VLDVEGLVFNFLCKAVDIIQGDCSGRFAVRNTCGEAHGRQQDSEAEHERGRYH
jgi:hypothetical protein